MENGIKLQDINGNWYYLWCGTKQVLFKRQCICGKIEYVRKPALNNYCFKCSHNLKGLKLKGIMNVGEKNGRWKGNNASLVAGRMRAQRKIIIGLCIKCEGKARDRHHIDGNVFNNNLENLMVLCTRCHMKEDGRLEQLILRNKRGKHGDFLLALS